MIDIIVKYLQCFLVPYWTLQWFFLMFKKIGNYKFSSYILYGIPFLIFVLFFFVESIYNYVLMGCIVFLVLSLLAFLGKKIYEAKW